MAPKVQGALRKELAAKAFDLHIKRDTNVEIAAKLIISRKLVPTLIREESGFREELFSDARRIEEALALGTHLVYQQAPDGRFEDELNDQVHSSHERPPSPAPQKDSLQAF